MKISPIFTILLAALLLGLAAAFAAEPPSRKSADVVFKRIGEHSLKLDIYLPEQGATHSPLVVWIHGGGWRAGNKEGVPILPFVASGFAVASVEYRLSGQAPFPAQIEDVNAAIRWLRAQAHE